MLEFPILHVLATLFVPTGPSIILPLADATAVFPSAIDWKPDAVESGPIDIEVIPLAVAELPMATFWVRLADEF